MIHETKGSVLMKGYRGKEEMDIGAVVSTLQKVGKLLADFGDRILELDINPFLAAPDRERALALDVRLRVGPIEPAIPGPDA